jgi:hypothetical protein
LDGKRLLVPLDTTRHFSSVRSREDFQTQIESLSAWASARRIRRRHRCSFVRFSSCCQTRRTYQPSFLNVRETRRSRALFRSSLRFQKSPLSIGFVACFGQLCQKQPSTKTTKRSFVKTKSGFPKILRRRRQPMMRFRRKRRSMANSVALLSRPRTRDMICDRFALEKTSGTKNYLLEACGGLEFVDV